MQQPTNQMSLKHSIVSLKLPALPVTVHSCWRSRQISLTLTSKYWLWIPILWTPISMQQTNNNKPDIIWLFIVFSHKWRLCLHIRWLSTQKVYFLQNFTSHENKYHFLFFFNFPQKSLHMSFEKKWTLWTFQLKTIDGFDR